jgi:hypothetical protein
MIGIIFEIFLLSSIFLTPLLLLSLIVTIWFCSRKVIKIQRERLEIEKKCLVLYEEESLDT